MFDSLIETACQCLVQAYPRHHKAEANSSSGAVINREIRCFLFSALTGTRVAETRRNKKGLDHESCREFFRGREGRFEFVESQSLKRVM